MTINEIQEEIYAHQIGGDPVVTKELELLCELLKVKTDLEKVKKAWKNGAGFQLVTVCEEICKE